MVSHGIEFPDHSGAPDSDQNEAAAREEISAENPLAPSSFDTEQLGEVNGQTVAGAPDAANILGAVDRVEGNFVVGWASDLDNPESPVSVELLLDGMVIASCLAGQERPDVAAKKPGISPRCGFRLAALHDLSQEISRLAVRIAGGPELHQRGAFRHGRKVRDGIHAGGVAQVSGFEIWGWVNTDKEAPHRPIEIETYVDGEWASGTKAARKTSLPALDSRTVKRGFVVQLSPSLFADGASHLISLRRKDGGELANSPIFITAGDFDEATNASAMPDWIEPARPQLVMLGAELGYLADHECSVAECGERSRRVLEALWFFTRLGRINPAEMLVRRDDREQAWFIDEAQTFYKPHDEVQAVLDPAIALDDLWLLGDGALRLRSSADLATAGKELRLFQLDGQGQHLIEIGRDSLRPESLFCSAELLNPFFPVLGLLLGEDEAIEGCSIIPFPSLCRGGAHYSELRGHGEFPDYYVALRSMSRALAQEYLGWPNAAAFAIGKLRIDLHGATGAERIFSDDFKNWLSAFFDLEAQPADQQLSIARQAAEHLRNALHPELSDLPHIHERVVSREADGKLTLTIPADGIPTLAALVSRRLRLSSDTCAQSGSYVLADEGTFSPRLLVSIPPLDASLRLLQPANAPLAFPLLADSRAATGEESGDKLHAPVLAIRFQAAWHANDSALLYPSAISSPVFCGSMSAEERESVLVSVILPLSVTTSRRLQLLRSIAEQTIADHVEIVAVSVGGEPPPEEAVQVLAEHFSGRYRVVKDDDSSFASQLNRAADCAQGTHLLFVEHNIILHDPRTLEALCLMALQDRVASAACVAVQEKPHGKGTTLSLASAGFLPARVSFANAPHLVFSETIASAGMPTATYPVVGNGFRLALVRASAWREIGGLDAMTFPTSNFDLDFCLRAIRADYIHLCTSAITAAYLGDASSDGPTDLVSLAYLPLLQWQSVFNSSAVIKELN